MMRSIVISLLLVPACLFADEANTWRKSAHGQIGPRSSAPLVYLPRQKAFTLLGGYISHEPRGPFPFDLLKFEAAAGVWKNWYSEGTAERGGEVGPVRDPGFKTPYFELADKEGARRLSPRQARFYNQYAYAPWDDCVYALVCGHTLRFDPRTQVWTDLAPSTSPGAVRNNYRQALCWGALCADPVNRELLLVGGCGADSEKASPGTWLYSTQENRWRPLDAEVEPGPRALAPLAFDNESRSIVLFGGDRLNELLGDTWVYDCASRTWQQRHPAVNPAPRFGHGLVSANAGVVLVGGKTYTSSTAYQAALYAPLPFEMWTYSVKADRWTRLKTRGQPSQIANAAMMIALNEQNDLLLVKESQGRLPDETWTCRLSIADVDEEGTKQAGVAPKASIFRSGPFDPEWYEQDLPPADEKAFASFLRELPANRFVDIEAPRWPINRQSGGWSTSAFDSDNDQLLNICGGHSSYFGNDTAHFSMKTGRWSISARPELALEFNYDLSGPGLLTFAGAPWSNHNYKTYAYDPLSKRLILVGPLTHFYDPVSRRWLDGERFATTPFAGSKYVTFICPTPHGVYVWARLLPFGSDVGLFRLEGKTWSRVKTTGAPLPGPVVDAGSTIVYDSRRDRFLLASVEKLKPGETPGQLWSIDRKTGECTVLDPKGRENLITPRFAREAVYIAKQDVFLFGSLIGAELRTPFYDPESNAWRLADIPGAEIMNSHRKTPGGSVDLGLLYDARRDLVYALLCHLRPGALRVLRVDAARLK